MSTHSNSINRHHIGHWPSCSQKIMIFQASICSWLKIGSKGSPNVLLPSLKPTLPHTDLWSSHVLTANQPLDSLIIHYHINMQMYTGFCVVRDRVAKWDWINTTTSRSKHWASCSVQWINYAETGNILFVGLDQEAVKQLGENVLKHFSTSKTFFFLVQNWI